MIMLGYEFIIVTDYKYCQLITVDNNIYDSSSEAIDI